MREPRLGGYPPCWGSHKDNIRHSYSSRVFFSVTHIVAVCCSVVSMIWNPCRPSSRLAYGPVTDNTWGELTTTWSYLAAAKILTWRVVQQGNQRLHIYEGHFKPSEAWHHVQWFKSKIANETQHTTFCSHERRCFACEVQPAADTNAKHSAVFHDSLIVSVAELMIMIIDNLTMMITDDLQIALFEVTELWNYNNLFSLDNQYFTINYRLSYVEP